MAVGDRATARDATLFLFERQQQADGSMPRNSLVNGKTAPDSFGTQLDETAYPMLMADELGLTDASLYADHIKPAANFVASHGPAFGVERWEEQERLLALDDRGRDRRADRRRAHRRRQSTTRSRRMSGAASPTTTSARSRAGRSPPTGRSRRATSSASRRPATRTPRSPTTSATAGRRSTSARSSTPASSSWRGSASCSASDPDVARVAAGRRRDDQARHGERPRLAPLQRRRLRRPRRATAARGRRRGQGTGHLWPALSAERAEQSLQTGDAAGAAALLDGMAQVRLRRRPHPRAGLGDPGPRRVAVRNTAGRSPRSASSTASRPARHRRSPGRPRRSCASFADIGAGRRRRPAASTLQRYVAHTQGDDAADGHEPGRPQRRRAARR